MGSSLGVDADISLDDADLHIEGEEAQDYFGGSVSSAGDVDGDGLSDFLVGAFGNDDGGLSAGKSYLFLVQALHLVYLSTLPMPITCFRELNQ